MLYLHSYQRKRRSESGQSLIEVSISMMFFLIFALGLLDLGRLYFIYVALEDSAGEAAVFMSITPDCNYAPGYTGDPDVDYSIVTPPLPIDRSSTNPKCNDPNNALFRARRAAVGYFNWDEPGVQIDVDYVTGGRGVGNTVRVEIRYPFHLWTPIINNIVGDDTLTITATATQTIMME